DVIKLNPSGSSRNSGNRRRCDLHRTVQQLEHALAGRHCRLKNVVLFAEVLNGPEEALRVLDEGRENTNAHKCTDHVKGKKTLTREFRSDTAYSQAANDVIATKPDYAGDGDRLQDFHDRVIDCVRHNRVLESLHVDGVYLGKFVKGALLAVKKLQHHHAADMFLQVGINACDGGSNATIGVTHLVAENLRSVRNERQDCQGDECQLPVHAQHDGGDAGKHKQIFEDGYHAGGKHFVQCVHIGGDSCNQAADGVLVVEPDVHALQVAEDLLAQI